MDSNNKTVITLYHADWCGHCKSFQKDWGLIKSDIDKLKKKGEMFDYKEYEDSKNPADIKKAGVRGFPTIMVTTKDGNTSKYTGPRDKESIMKTLKSNISTQAGGSSNKEIDYKLKYFKYKAKYMQLKMK